MIFSKKHYLSLLLIITLSLLLSGSTSVHKTRGMIEAGETTYSFTSSAHSVAVYNKEQQIFTHKCGASEMIVSTGYSNYMKSLYCFKVRFEQNGTKSLISVTPAGEELIAGNLAKLPYNPSYTGNSGRYVAYIDSEFTLTIIDADSNSVIHKIRFDKPVYNLSTNGNTVTFYRLKGFGDEKISFSSDNIGSGNLNFRYGTVINTVSESAKNSLAQLNKRRFLCAGDSITRGKIGTVVRIDLGYIPKLHILINDQLYSDEVSMVNYGKNGETTREMLSRFDYILDASEKAAFLLLHMGTNDMPVEGISPMQTFLNIKEMVLKARNRGMLPVISTLIPRKPKDSLTGDFRPFNIETNNLLKAFAVEAGIPIADFWDIFINHPGYDTDPDIMSDHVHPGRDGYQLMANEWIKKIPPLPVTGSAFDKSKPNKIVFNWSGNPEMDIDHYIIKYSRGGDELNRTVQLKVPSTTINFLNPVFLSPFSFRIKLTIEAVDKDGNKSPVSTLMDSDN